MWNGRFCRCRGTALTTAISAMGGLHPSNCDTWYLSQDLAQQKSIHTERVCD